MSILFYLTTSKTICKNHCYNKRLTSSSFVYCIRNKKCTCISFFNLLISSYFICLSLIRRNHSSRLRTREQIEQSGAYEKPAYRPMKTNSRSANEKDRLANLMAFGADLDPAAKAAQAKKNVRPITPPTPPPELDRFDECEGNDSVEMFSIFNSFSSSSFI